MLSWFEINHRDFPWRDNSMNSYQYIIAEVLLQRTKAETIAKFYPKFILKFPDWSSIDSSPQAELANILIPIGLYQQRSIRLKKLAKEMLLLNGEIPKDKTSLEKLTLFGQYIVNAILLFVNNKATPLIDVNMARILERFFGKRKLADIRYDPYLQKLASDIVKHDHAIKLNWAILDFAALVCKSRKPLCQNCSLTTNCKYYKNNT